MGTGREYLFGTPIETPRRQLPFSKPPPQQIHVHPVQLICSMNRIKGPNNTRQHTRKLQTGSSAKPNSVLFVVCVNAARAYRRSPTPRRSSRSDPRVTPTREPHQTPRRSSYTTAQSWPHRPPGPTPAENDRCAATKKNRREHAVLALSLAKTLEGWYGHMRGVGVSERYWDIEIDIRDTIIADLGESVDERHARQRAERKPRVDLAGTGAWQITGQTTESTTARGT